ncbi:Membrane-associated kinase regulator [Actinidia chinensis var. chinensis]|uniref:Membrane-associated kinase regulator n=1 Tax=Actinidia chinensis var. chinensis TaxID=1590841 RepID=A0A2R6QWR2_ACTCC|nr:Membrane-associated kinase regulator [Actinidia chinensis var. chinensis]
MENNPRRKNSFGEKFSFPIQVNQDFEFGCLTPGSPSSPADHLFFNGRLLPHAFPFQQANSTVTRSTSRTSSTGSSKDSLLSSRSNSKSSSCSTSARTSTSTDSTERRSVLLHHQPKQLVTSEMKKGVLVGQYGCSQRWQFITAAPIMNQQVSRRRKAEIPMKKASDRRGESSWFGWRFLRWFVGACKECHAIKPSTRDGVVSGNIEWQ